MVIILSPAFYCVLRLSHCMRAVNVLVVLDPAVLCAFEREEPIRFVLSSEDAGW